MYTFMWSALTSEFSFWKLYISTHIIAIIIIAIIIIIIVIITMTYHHSNTNHNMPTLLETAANITDKIATNRAIQKSYLGVTT